MIRRILAFPFVVLGTVLVVAGGILVMIADSIEGLRG